MAEYGSSGICANEYPGTLGTCANEYPGTLYFDRNWPQFDPKNHILTFFTHAHGELFEHA